MIGKNVQIGKNVLIVGPAVIGDQVVLGDHVEILPGSVVENGVQINSHSLVADALIMEKSVVPAQSVIRNAIRTRDYTIGVNHMNDADQIRI